MFSARLLPAGRSPDVALDPFHEVRFLSRIRRIEKVDFRSTIIRRDVSGHLPYRQSDRVCSFCFVLSGGV